MTFWIKSARKGCFWLKTKKLRITIKFGMSETPNFILNRQFWFFGSNFPKKGISGLKHKKQTSPWNSTYSNQSKYRISSWTDNFDFLDQICPKWEFPFKKKLGSSLNSAYPVSLGTKFHLKQTISSFWTKRVVSSQKQEK